MKNNDISHFAKKFFLPALVQVCTDDIHHTYRLSEGLGQGQKKICLTPSRCLTSLFPSRLQTF